eukprot:8692309-Lingulodinium_polyedra.AAC.1
MASTTCAGRPVQDHSACVSWEVTGKRQSARLNAGWIALACIVVHVWVTTLSPAAWLATSRR